MTERPSPVVESPTMTRFAKDVMQRNKGKDCDSQQKRNFGSGKKSKVDDGGEEKRRRMRRERKK